jgi:hypothetical protein
LPTSPPARQPTTVIIRRERIACERNRRSGF